MDPDGAEVGTDDPWVAPIEPPTYENLKAEQPLYIEGGDPFDYSSGLTIDGLPVTQAEFNRRMQNGSAGVQVSMGGRPMIFVTNQQQLSHLTYDVFQVEDELRNLPQSQRWGGTYYVDTFDVDLDVGRPFARAIFSHAPGPQNAVPTGFILGPSANFNYGETVILKQVYDRINKKDCTDFVNELLKENNVSKDLNELWKLTNKAVLNKWDSNLTAEGLGVSQNEMSDIQQGFAGKGVAVTLSDRTRIYLGDKMFLREGNDSQFNIFSSHTNIDTAGPLVHELFHIAGITHPKGQGFDFDAEIHKHCGLANTNF